MASLLAATALAALSLLGNPFAAIAQRGASPPPQPAATGGGSGPPAPRRLTGDEIDAMNRKAGDAAPLLDLRPLRAGEAQAFGHLQRIECVSGGSIRVYVKTDTETLMASAPKLQSIELRTYRGDTEFMLGCGARPAGDRVYLTWRSTPAPASSAGRQTAAAPARPTATTPRNVGPAVALEFLPTDFVPAQTAK